MSGAMSGVPPELHKAGVLRRRRRGRNWAVFIILVSLCCLFYAITIVKMTRS